MTANVVGQMIPRVGVAIVACAAAAWVITAGCKAKDKPEEQAATAASAKPVKGIKISLRLDSAKLKEAAKLKRQVRKGRFPARVLRKKKNAQLFLHLAATSNAANVIAASLRGMGRTYASAGAKRGKLRANADYGAVVATHLRSQNPQVQAAAIAAAPNAIKGRRPYRPVINELVSIVESHPNPGGRMAALGALRHVAGYRKNKTVAGAMLRALEHEAPPVKARALQLAGGRSVRRLALKREFHKHALKLMKHPNAVVRGRAASLAVGTRGKEEPLLEQVSAMLEDESPYIRSVAARSVARLGDPRGIHQLIKLVDDTAPEAMYLPYRTLTGGRSKLRAGRRQRTVQSSAVNAIARLSKAMKSPFEPAPIDKEDRAGSLKRNAAAISPSVASNGCVCCFDMGASNNPKTTTFESALIIGNHAVNQQGIGSVQSQPAATPGVGTIAHDGVPIKGSSAEGEGQPTAEACGDVVDDGIPA